MRKLGISIYPEHASIEAICAYIKKASDYGFSRIFTCMMSLDDQGLDGFKTILNFANAHGMEVIADIDPAVMTNFNIDYTDLGFFKTLGLSGIRLDLGFSGMEESHMSQNPYGLAIELNMSNGTQYIDNIMSHSANSDYIIGCHNFYPHCYTGLKRSHFISCSEQFKTHGLRTAAFVSSQSASYGPWPVSEGLPTLESHRLLSVTTQAKDLWQTGLIDDVIIGNMFASDEELKALGSMNRKVLELGIEILSDATALDRRILLEEFHFNRGDVSDYMIRSTQSRVKYKDESFKPQNTQDMTCGDVIIENDLYTRYKGELQVALQEMKNSGRSNIVARVVEEERFLLKDIKPWQSFSFKEMKNDD
jgi:hypothetical protein